MNKWKRAYFPRGSIEYYKCSHNECGKGTRKPKDECEPIEEKEHEVTILPTL